MTSNHDAGGVNQGECKPGENKIGMGPAKLEKMGRFGDPKSPKPAKPGEGKIGMGPAKLEQQAE